MSVRIATWGLVCAFLAGCGSSHGENQPAVPAGTHDGPNDTSQDPPKPSPKPDAPMPAVDDPDLKPEREPAPRPPVWTFGLPADLHPTCAGLLDGADETFYIVGSFRGGVLPDAGEESGPVTAGVHITRTAFDGQVVWRRYIRGHEAVEAVAVAQDDAGDIYVAANHTGSVYLGDGERLATQVGAGHEQRAALIAKFRADDGRLVWARPVAEERGDVRVTDLTVTPHGVAVVSGNYARLGREAFVERFHQKTGEATRRVVFDYPGFRGPLRIAADATTLVVTGGMSEKIELPDQYDFTTLEGESEHGSFVAWFNIGEFAFRGAQALADVDVVAVAQHTDGRTALVTARRHQDSAGLVGVFDPRHRCKTWEPVSAATDKPVRVRFGSNGTVVLSRTLSAEAAAENRRVERGIAQVRGDGDAAVTVFSSHDVTYPQTFTAGGSGLTTISDVLLAHDGVVHTCGQYTETSAFWNQHSTPVVLRAEDAPAGFVSRFRP